jgi:hypothetical protein
MLDVMAAALNKFILYANCQSLYAPALGGEEWSQLSRLITETFFYMRQATIHPSIDEHVSSD